MKNSKQLIVYQYFKSIFSIKLHKFKLVLLVDTPLTIFLSLFTRDIKLFIEKTEELFKKNISSKSLGFKFAYETKIDFVLLTFFKELNISSLPIGSN